MKLPIRLLAFVALLVTAVPVQAATVSSPDGRIVVTLDVTGEGVPYYSVMRDGKPVIDQSDLGFNFTDSPPMRRDFKIIGETTATADTRWEQPWGEKRFIRNNHKELAIALQQSDPGARRMTVRVRVFDDGVGFRYEFPDQASLKTANIAEELTEFAIAGDGTAWSIPAGDWNRYEYIYSKSPISALSTVNTPVTMHLADGPYLSFHEAALVDYSSMWLRRMRGTTLRAELAPSSRGAKVVRHGAFNTPWRTILITDSPKGLFESAMELNLNEPNKLGDVSWVHPQKFIGIWWDLHLNHWTWASGPDHGATTAHTKKYIDFAAKHGFGGVLVEGWNKGWDGTWFGNGRDFSFTEAYPDYDLKAVTDYARKKGVDIIGHDETGGNIANFEKQMDAAFAMDQKLGIEAVKTGYVADAGGLISCNADIYDPCKGEVYEWHDGQRSVQHHLAVALAAAKYHVAIDAHEPVKDTGLRRTYPNLVAREGARGAEYDAWGVPKNPPSHVPTLVFTRLLSGPMDYTPGVLSLAGRGNTPIPSTIARQLAYYVVIYSPLQMAADTIENLAKYPQELKFIEQVPVDWSDSIMLDGAIGEHAVIARKDRHSDAWYVGGVTDDKARTANLTLDFLDPNRSYTATIYRDGDGADGLGDQAAKHRIAIGTRTVRKGEKLAVPMARAGGFAISLAPTKR
ncbi:glycoside hydrolase family 97 protein [Porphyrobacter algicida]|uniref:Glycoside hydrolase family 97 protein n=1 Tax=Qipengyuania algicida TaxID=1836209 RepID=A0A845AJ60_9SPHN|nr:glycoside hydrolase family 97 protein [Qipengyuania algicida]MXP29469.1 glycoside hydrolase family 97 protein [Qipengyuania algicida]